VLGMATGLALLTKSGIYVALPLVLLAIVVRHVWLAEQPFSGMGVFEAVALYLLPALSMVLPWWVRNLVRMAVWICWGWRAQPGSGGALRTAEFLATMGRPAGYLTWG